MSTDHLSRRQFLGTLAAVGRQHRRRRAAARPRRILRAGAAPTGSRRSRRSARCASGGAACSRAWRTVRSSGWKATRPPADARPALRPGQRRHGSAVRPGPAEVPACFGGPARRGPFKRISWDEALDLLAAKLKAIRETHGAEATRSFPTASGRGSSGR